MFLKVWKCPSNHNRTMTNIFKNYKSFHSYNFLFCYSVNFLFLRYGDNFILQKLHYSYIAICNIILLIKIFLLNYFNMEFTMYLLCYYILFFCARKCIKQFSLWLMDVILSTNYGFNKISRLSKISTSRKRVGNLFIQCINIFTIVKQNINDASKIYNCNSL